MSAFTPNSAQAYLEVYEQCATDAAFLWLLRSQAVNRPDFTPNDLLQLEERLHAQVSALMTAPEEAWTICKAALALGEPGELFTAAVLAFRSLDVRKIQCVVEAGLASDEAMPGLISALGWLPGRLCHSWLEKFLTSKDLDHKYLAIAACSVRREDPAGYLHRILQREDCLAHTRLHARCLRLIGELKLTRLLPALKQARASSDAEVVFWSHWSSVLLGDELSMRELKPFVFDHGKHREKAIQAAFRCLPVDEARRWIAELAKNVEDRRALVKATAALGDPQAIDWLIAVMREPALARLAGEAFFAITGIELEENGLANELPDLTDAVPNDDPNDESVEMDEDEHLPWPNVEKIAAVWQTYRANYTNGQRYFYGRSVAFDPLKSTVMEGRQRQRHAAALEMALLRRDQPLVNTHRMTKRLD